MARPTSGWVFWVIAGSVCVLFMLPKVATAAPYEPPELPGGITEPAYGEGFPECPSPPAGYEGEDQTVGELRSLRSEEVEACSALSDRLDVLVERLWWVTTEAVRRHEQGVVSNEKLASLVEGLCGSAESPCSVEGALEGEGSEAVVTAVENNGLAVKSALWFLAGCVCSGIFAYGVYRMGMIRA